MWFRVLLSLIVTRWLRRSRSSVSILARSLPSKGTLPNNTRIRLPFTAVPQWRAFDRLSSTEDIGGSFPTRQTIARDQERFREIALRHLHVADIVVGY